ncbi:LysR family transcriptional regulator [Dongia soli]|uniref:LysR family transcriptional regulator n=1 Tax=Dongia soli TaxID=600628 RepID=A0ABU5ECG8_9PROT|nr:LysR family transcriptional regulator [Dongia soli]MDY0883725.1 LysR family transcriptional regulator [Dongia soli]
MADLLRRFPPLNSLRVFEVVTRHLNFRLAAEELGVTQGAVAQQIRGLEAELDLKLFDRHPRSLQMTEAGRSYITNIRRALELIADATEALRSQPFHLTISVTPTFAAKWLLPGYPPSRPATRTSTFALSRLTVSRISRRMRSISRSATDVRPSGQG